MINEIVLVFLLVLAAVNLLPVVTIQFLNIFEKRDFNQKMLKMKPFACIRVLWLSA